MTLSRWSDDTENSMESIISNMLNYSNWHVPIKDPLTDEDLQFRITKSFPNDKTTELNGTEIKYNVINYDYEKVRNGEENNEMRSIRLYPTSGYLVVYSDTINTQYITNRSNSDPTKTILRKVNNYTGQLEIKSNPYQISEDLFTWMISKVLNNTEESIDETSLLSIKKIIGFKGSSDDKLAEVIGSGNRIMNSLSTLAFLFDNEEVTYVKPVIEYNGHTVELFLNLSGSIDINLENYIGNFFMDPPDEMKAKLALMISLETIPKIISNYGNDLTSRTWSVEKKIEFIKSIGEEIQTKVNEKVRGLEDTEI
ncbi:hypothetical protein [Paenisporosarcina sp. TG-14]|uniref:hypothetical protein n=1 Tax=Paenisporosarcina sp. TG-14 TaxID=1231057 RepID=UPI00031A77CA|nr:hypothetical protein [Paenisporosarcina sp. TG-14]